MTAENKEQLARTFLSVLSHPDPEVIKKTTVDDVIWSFPGASPISGEAHGVDGIMKRARTIASYGVKVEFIRRVARLRAHSANGGRSIEWSIWINLCGIVDELTSRRFVFPAFLAVVREGNFPRPLFRAHS
jgi:hypothetical protein